MKKTIVYVMLMLLISLLFITPAFAQEYRVDEIGLTTEIPEDFYVFTKDTDSSYEGFAHFGVTKEQMLARMEKENKYLYAVDADVKTEISFYMKKTDLPDFSSLSSESVQNISKSMMKNVAAVGYTAGLGFEYKHPQTVFAEISGSKYNPAMEIEGYYTVCQGNAIWITNCSYDGDITATESNVFKNVVDNTVFDEELLKSDDSKETSAFTYRDSGIRFDVPENFAEKKTKQQLGEYSRAFVCENDLLTMILYGRTDIYDTLTSEGKSELKRNDMDAANMSVEDVAEYLGVDADSVHKAKKNEKACFFRTERIDIREYDALTVNTSAIEYIFVENGVMYRLIFTGSDKNKAYNYYDKLVESVEFPAFDSKEIVVATASIVLLIILAVIVVLIKKKGKDTVCGQYDADIFDGTAGFEVSDEKAKTTKGLIVGLSVAAIAIIVAVAGLLVSDGVLSSEETKNTQMSQTRNIDDVIGCPEFCDLTWHMRSYDFQERTGTEIELYYDQNPVLENQEILGMTAQEVRISSEYAEITGVEIIISDDEASSGEIISKYREIYGEPTRTANDSGVEWIGKNTLLRIIHNSDHTEIEYVYNDNIIYSQFDLISPDMDLDPYGLVGENNVLGMDINLLIKDLLVNTDYFTEDGEYSLYPMFDYMRSGYDNTLGIDLITGKDDRYIDKVQYYIGESSSSTENIVRIKTALEQKYGKHDSNECATLEEMGYYTDLPSSSIEKWIEDKEPSVIVLKWEENDYNVYYHMFIELQQNYSISYVEYEAK